MSPARRPSPPRGVTRGSQARWCSETTRFRAAGLGPASSPGRAGSPGPTSGRLRANPRSAAEPARGKAAPHPTQLLSLRSTGNTFKKGASSRRSRSRREGPRTPPHPALPRPLERRRTGEPARAGRRPDRAGLAGPLSDRHSLPPMEGGERAPPANSARGRAGPAPLSVCSQSAAECEARSPRHRDGDPSTASTSRPPRSSSARLAAAAGIPAPAAAATTHRGASLVTAAASPAGGGSAYPGTLEGGASPVM